MKFDRDFELTVLLSQNTIVNLKPLESPQFEEVLLSTTGSSSTPGGQQMMQKGNSSSGISLYDCISWFSQEETLTGNNKWYCS